MPTCKVEAKKAPRYFADVIRLIHNKQCVVITDHGRPIATIMPADHNEWIKRTLSSAWQTTRRIRRRQIYPPISN